MTRGGQPYTRSCSPAESRALRGGSLRNTTESSPGLQAGHKTVKRGAPGRTGLVATAQEGAELQMYAGRLCGRFQPPSPPRETPVCVCPPRHLPTALLIKPHKYRARNFSVDKYQAVFQTACVTRRHEHTGNINTKTTGGGKQQPLRNTNARRGEKIREGTWQEYLRDSMWGLHYR